MNTFQVIIINGSARSGKDLFVGLFQKNYEHICINWSTIDKVKEIAKNSFGWNGEKTDEARLLLSNIKKAWDEYNNGTFVHMAEKINSHFQVNKEKSRNDIIYFIHCRESSEIQKFKDNYKDNCKAIRLIRERVSVPNNDSDKNVASYKYDYTIENNGTIAELETKAIKLINDLQRLDCERLNI